MEKKLGGGRLEESENTKLKDAKKKKKTKEISRRVELIRGAGEG